MSFKDFPWMVQAARRVADGNAGQKVAISNTVGTSTALLTNDATQLDAPRRIIVTATVPCLYRTAPTNAASAVSTSKFDGYIPANSPRAITIPTGHAYLDVISEPLASGTYYAEVVEWDCK